MGMKPGAVLSEQGIRERFKYSLLFRDDNPSHQENNKNSSNVKTEIYNTNSRDSVNVSSAKLDDYFDNIAYYR